MVMSDDLTLTSTFVSFIIIVDSHVLVLANGTWCTIIARGARVFFPSSIGPPLAIFMVAHHIYTAELLFPTAQRLSYIPIERIFSHLRIAATLLYRDDISVTVEE